MKKLPITNELQIFAYLKPRMNFSSENKLQFRRLQNGYAGEKAFHKKVQENLSEHCIPLFDLLLESDGSIFQVDCLIICNDTIFLYEVKNYKGDYYMENNRWYTLRAQKEIRNPLSQLERSHYLLNHLIQKFPHHFEIKPFITFVNQSFMLYQAPINTQFIHPTQITRHIQVLNRQANMTTHIKKQREFAKWLMNQQSERSFSNTPEYTYDTLDKGVFCPKCSRKMIRFSQTDMQCKSCRHTENIETIILYHIEQFIILFPNMKITTKKIYNWCGEAISRNTVLRILKQNFKLIRKGRHSYYVK